jgi:phage protein D
MRDKILRHGVAIPSIELYKKLTESIHVTSLHVLKRKYQIPSKTLLNQERAQNLQLVSSSDKDKTEPKLASSKINKRPIGLHTGKRVTAAAGSNSLAASHNSLAASHNSLAASSNSLAVCGIK